MRTVLIVDDSEIFRRGLRDIVEKCAEWQICGEAETADEGIRVAEELKPDAVLLDISMPGMSGIEAIRHIRSKIPHSKILILSLHESTNLRKSVLEAGASGYVVKQKADSELLHALNTVTGELRARATRA